jgi:molybdopterin synthase sulfur carrier subunit
LLFANNYEGHLQIEAIELNNSVTVRLYAAARSAAGQGELAVAPGRLDLILADIALENPRLEQVLLQCSFLLDGVVLHEKETIVPAGSTLDVLPPFAGG